MQNAMSPAESAAVQAAVTDLIAAETLPISLAAQWLETPLGPMLAVAGERGLHILEFLDRAILSKELTQLRRAFGGVAFGPNPVLTALAGQLAEYFDGARTAFDLPLAPVGGAFHHSVWTALREIPIGVTCSYKDLSLRLGNLKAIRAVAQANGANPISILIPCHRVIGADGTLVGYGGKLWRKRWLLAHEQRHAPAETGAQLGLPGFG